MNAQERVAWLQRRAAADVVLSYDESFFKIPKESPASYEIIPGSVIQDMSTARMGRDPIGPRRLLEVF